MSELISLVFLAGMAVLAWLVWSHMQQNAKLLQTRTVKVDGGLRFEAHAFSVEMQQTAKCVKVSAKPGTLKVTTMQGGTPQNHDVASDFCLPAAGLQVTVARTPAPSDGHSAGRASNTFDIAFNTPVAPGEEPKASGHTSVLLQGVPEPVATSFQPFATRVTLWADKLKKFAEQEQAEALQAAQEAAALEAQAQEDAARAAQAEEATNSLDLAGQIAKWREAAGFSGKYSEVGTHDKGGINWFIDLDPEGRITLHSHKRTVSTTLHGASIRALPKSIEIGVRDEFWSEGDPLLMFEVLQGTPPNERRTWKEWLEAAQSRMDISMRKGY
jgi:hypothetical protein